MSTTTPYNKTAGGAASLITTPFIVLGFGIIAGVVNLLVPVDWSRERALGVMLLVTFLLRDFMVTGILSIWLLAYKLLTGVWYVAPTKKS